SCSSRRGRSTRRRTSAPAMRRSSPRTSSRKASLFSFPLREHRPRRERPMTRLKWDVLTIKRGSSTPGVPARREHLEWVTNTVALVHGERDAVLVDTFLTERDSKELSDWIVERGKSLVAIYITHAHGDHYLGLKLVLDRFPGARSFATATVAAAI